VVNNKIDYLLIFLLSFLPVTWFRGNFLINHGDQSYIVNPGFSWKTQLLTAWNPLYGPGRPLGGAVGGLFYYLFPMLTKIGFSLELTEKIMYLFVFFLAAFSMYTLAYGLFGKKRLLAWTSMAAYLFSFYPLFAFWNSFITLAFFYACAPLLIFLFWLFLVENQKKYVVFWLLLASIAFVPAAVNPANLLVFFFLHLLVLGWILFFEKNINIKTLAIKTGMILVLFFLLNSWWIMPFVGNYNGPQNLDNMLRYISYE